MEWNWQELIFGVITAILGWLTNIIRPAPGTQRKVRKV